MKLRSVFLMAALGALMPLISAQGAVVFLGEGAIPGDASDQSKLGEQLEDGASPHNRVGGLGSALTYSGHGNTYFAVPDRGPAGGATSYINRLYRIDIKLTPLATNQYRVEPLLKETRLIRHEDGRHFIGHAAAFDATNSPDSLRLDPEGLRLGSCGDTAFLCDEYGPHLYEIDLATGKRLRSLPIPRKFLVDFPGKTFQEERDHNLSGRQTNRGFEGLAITPDGSRLLAVLQQPLLQDGALNEEKKPNGVNCRILEIDIRSGAMREFVYPMEQKSNGLSEILAINDHEFLVIEHDAKALPDTTFKKIYRIDLADATDVRAVQSLPASAEALNGADEESRITPVRKTLFLDLLTAGIPDMPEKVEGLTFGPDLKDGRHLLIATVDNDFSPTLGNRFWAFGVDAADLPGYQAMRIADKHNGACRHYASSERQQPRKKAAGTRLVSHRASERVALKPAQ